MDYKREMRNRDTLAGAKASRQGQMKNDEIIQFVWLCKWRGLDYWWPFTITAVYNIYENILLKRFYQKQDWGIMTVNISTPDLFNANKKSVWEAFPFLSVNHESSRTRDDNYIEKIWTKCEHAKKLPKNGCYQKIQINTCKNRAGKPVFMRGFRGYRRNGESPFRALTPISNILLFHFW